jgi:hypothetical protein
VAAGDDLRDAAGVARAREVLDELAEDAVGIGDALLLQARGERLGSSDRTARRSVG